ncbi:response regulator receiver protein [Candidatus Nitrosopumilus koreensis AR1]|uniref:Response regulator receiver protein n=1 Tax=Candidatus Nitrosopumilus koreensis AR1 TaxID=1229908 RepID=K0B2U9_9ARCH|nr:MULTISPECIES: response regulator [Nitrosopumilus]AFS80353.1 response regulator receiver protein [Candidatus Nitrosopumilus koreensis AR1]
MTTNKLILIVDDDIPLLENTAYMIETLGYDVVTAKDGMEAVDVYRSAQPSMTFMDVKMPKQDGFDAFFKIKEFDPDAKVVLITAYNMDEKKHLKAKSMNLLETIEKPYDMEKLETTLDKYLNS